MCAGYIGYCVQSPKALHKRKQTGRIWEVTVNYLGIGCGITQRTDLIHFKLWLL